MTEVTAPSSFSELPQTHESTLSKRLLRLKRTANFVGLLGVRQALPLIAERVTQPNSNRLRRITIDELRKPFYLTSSHSDIAMTGEIIGAGTYDLPGLDYEINGNLILDLGANIGVATALFASRYTNSHIVAVEPHPRNLSILRQNAWEYDAQVDVLPNAVCLETGRVGLVNPNERSSGRHAVYEFSGADDSGIVADAITPEELREIVEFYGNNVGLLKMNIEGLEKPLLASQRFDSILRSTRVAIIEAHDRKQTGTSEVVMAAAGRTGLELFDKRGSFYFFQHA